MSSHCGIKNCSKILTQFWLCNNDLIFKFLPHVLPTSLMALTVQICYKKLKTTQVSNYWVAVPYVNPTLLLVELRKNTLNSYLMIFLSIRSLSSSLMNFPLILPSTPVDTAMACKSLGLTRMSYTALNGASHQRTENIWWWNSCPAAATLHTWLTCSPNTHFFLCCFSSTSSILFRSTFLLFKNSQIKDRCVRIGRGTSELS